MPGGIVASIVVLSILLAASADAKPVSRKPPPAGVVELTGVGFQSLVELADGSLLAANGQVSTDDGSTWGAARPLAEGLSADGILRLKSGALALSGQAGGRYALSLSRDEGRTWSAPAPVELLGTPYHDVVTQLRTGRLLYPSRICFANDKHPGLTYVEASAYGTWLGLPLQVEGHYHYPEIDIGSVSYSDDEGASWRLCEGQLMGWFDARGVTNGRGGITACDEPSVAETRDGKVIFFARSTVGRIVQSESTDGGQTWSAVRPTELANSYSPPRLRRIPSTGDLLCVWNQVSREEIRRGYRRGRLSGAVSRDGLTWEHFRTIEVSEGLADIERVPPQHPLTPVVAAADVGRLPPGFATFDYANVCFARDRAYVFYQRSWVEAAEGSEATTLGERKGTTTKPGEIVLRIYPLGWFYGK
ncbi:MAG: exo-alpha-sialidase [Armatimonadetes bacterium]|nr:exo-alpha-sialidase [Armatimonadota bacterium]